MSKKDYYEVLGVSKAASQADLKKAYHSLAMKYHPDRPGAGKEAEQKIKEINEAYDILKDEQKRSAYDQYGHNAFDQSYNGTGGRGFEGNINDIFGDFFSDFMGGRTKRSAQASGRGSDLKYNISISLEEAFKGADKNITFSAEAKCTTCNATGSAGDSKLVTCDMCKGHGVVKMSQGFFSVEQGCSKCQGLGQIIKNPCKTCFGMGRYSQKRTLLVNVPAGIENNTTIRLNGEGEAGFRGGSAGSLHIVVTVKPHDIFKTDGADLHCKLSVAFTAATLGGEMQMPTIGGEKVLLKIPAGTQNGNKLRLKDKGMTKVRTQSKGDLFAHIHIITPLNLNKKQKEALELFRKEMNEDGQNNANFFDKMKNLWS